MKTLFFKLIFLILFICATNIFSQEKEIAKLLNENLNNDLKIKPEYNHFGDTISIVKPYVIKNGILTVELEYRGNNEPYKEKMEVPLSKIKSISKDINVIFETMGEEDVAIGEAHYATAKQLGYFRTRSAGMFFTGIRSRKDNRKLGEDLQKAFAKAGYKIELGSWYD